MAYPLEFPEQKLARPFVVRANPLAIPSQADIFADPVTCISINGEWSSHVIGVLGALEQLDAWLGTDNEVYDAIQQIDRLLEVLATGGCLVTADYPNHINWLPDEMQSEHLPNSLLSFHSNTSSMFAGVWQPATADIANSWSYRFLCAQMTASLTVTHTMRGNAAIVSVYLDTNFVASFDMYSSTTVWNVDTVVDLGTLAQGEHTLQFKTASKNSLSSNYLAQFVRFFVRGLIV